MLQQCFNQPAYIGYCYPTSEMAQELGKPDEGTWYVVESDGQRTLHETRYEAIREILENSENGNILAELLMHARKLSQEEANALYLRT